ncbi:MAG: hypothetical protein EBU93_03390, partial [Chlamydiae bacterium]|nr:hypothetical protein [Chlamydiota bacterium]
MDSFNSCPELVIDWELKPTITEIPYDELTSQYDNEIDHRRSYSKALHTSKTCGNFLLTKVNITGGNLNPNYPIFHNLYFESGGYKPDLLKPTVATYYSGTISWHNIANNKGNTTNINWSTPRSGSLHHEGSEGNRLILSSNYLLSLN